MPTSAAANAPNACESAVRCGIAVIGTQTPMARPSVEPSKSPTMIQVKLTISKCMRVPMMAIIMPNSARCMPRLAVSGWLRPLSPRIKRTEASR